MKRFYESGIRSLQSQGKKYQAEEEGVVRVTEDKGENCKIAKLQGVGRENKLRIGGMVLLRNKLLSLGRDQGTNRPTVTFEI